MNVFPETFRVMTDEHIPNALVDQLIQQEVDAVRLIDLIETGTPDPIVLDYCHKHGYALITLDTNIQKHISQRHSDGKAHAGIFIGTGMQGAAGIGKMIDVIVLYDQAIKLGAATLENDVYNQVIYVS